MATNPPADLFACAGIDLLQSTSAPTKRCFRPAQIGVAERAASGRLEGVRRSRPAPRGRVGPARSFSTAIIVPFPLIRNASAVAEVVAALPHGYSPELNKRRDQELYRLRDKLASNGISNADAWLCARQVVHVAYIERVTQAHEEAGIL